MHRRSAATSSVAVVHDVALKFQRRKAAALSEGILFGISHPSGSLLGGAEWPLAKEASGSGPSWNEARFHSITTFPAEEAHLPPDMFRQLTRWDDDGAPTPSHHKQRAAPSSTYLTEQHQKHGNKTNAANQSGSVQSHDVLYGEWLRQTNASATREAVLATASRSVAALAERHLKSANARYVHRAMSKAVMVEIAAVVSIIGGFAFLFAMHHNAVASAARAHREGLRVVAYQEYLDTKKLAALAAHASPIHPTATTAKKESSRKR